MKKYIKGIDGLKAIAIIAITFYHFFPDTFKGGFNGVCLFFVITGFLLSQQDFHSFSIREFYKKRIKRIYPGLLLVVFLTLSVYFCIDSFLLDGMRQEVLSVLLGYNNWWQIFQDADYFTRILNSSCFTHLWYLSIELQFYLIWPLLVVVFNKITKKNKNYPIILCIILAMCSCLAMALCLPQGITRVYYGFDTRVFAILLGCAIGLFYKNYKIKGKDSKKIFGLCLLVSILIFIFVDGNNTMLYRGGMLLITLLFVVMLVMTIYPSFGIGRILEWKPLKYIGTISYEIYLWQYPVLFICNYLHFDYPIVQVFIVFVLAIALHVLLNVKKKVVANGILAVSLCVGSFGLVQAKDKKEDIESLKQEMEENTKKMEQDNQDKVSTSNLVFVGDSILLGCYDEIKEMYPDCVIDAVVSRHMGEEKTALQTIEANGQLKDTVIVCMGTNGVIYDFLAEELMSYLGDRTVYWVNNYCPTLSWQDSNNAYLNELAQKYSNLKIIDWYTVASSHPEYLSSDGIHPNEEGSKAYASLIQKEIEGK